MALLIFRSSLDAFSEQGLPAVFAVGLDALVIAYVLTLYLTHQKIQIDRFWWLFAFWVVTQGLWPVLTAVGGLPLDSSFFSESLRDWVRLFSWLMVYLGVNQLQDRFSPSAGNRLSLSIAHYSNDRGCATAIAAAIIAAQLFTAH